MRRRSDSGKMPPELLALLEGCKASPEDDQARLVLTDWQEEHGQDDRAQLIRALVRRARRVRREPGLPLSFRVQAIDTPGRHRGDWP
jgi:uncharacterized protein (TIGR02996 family)